MADPIAPSPTKPTSIRPPPTPACGSWATPATYRRGPLLGASGDDSDGDWCGRGSRDAVEALPSPRCQSQMASKRMQMGPDHAAGRQIRSEVIQLGAWLIRDRGGLGCSANAVGGKPRAGARICRSEHARLTVKYTLGCPVACLRAPPFMRFPRRETAGGGAWPSPPGRLRWR
jgi:hypothetical protein